MTDAAAPPLMTAEELERMPDDGQFYELVRGRLVRVSPSSSISSIVSASVLAFVAAFVRQHKLGIVGDAQWGLKLASNPDTVRAPDVAFVRAERIPPEGIPRGFFPGAPDLAVEVRSPSDSTAEILRKVADYLAAGTRLVWVLDPTPRTATIYRPIGEPTVLGEDGVLDGEDVLPGFTLPLRDVWV
jgi:Uma2 family endonuclease